MNSEELAVEQYKMYCKHKDEFVERSFRTNKFYLISVIAIIIAMYLMSDTEFAFNLTSTLILSLIGIGICMMWWINVDSYSFLNKIKLSKVIEEMEKTLPFKPYTMEFQAISDFKKNKKGFMFADMQKILVLFIMLLFIVLAITEVTPLILNGCPIS